MATKDLMYIYDKQTFTQSTLGEVQQGFDMSFVIDGTKDSAKIEVIGFNETEIQPYTICYHPNTNSWWIVSNDKVESFRHEGGFIYRHTLKLLGAVELLNARDLTDCGFNANRYTLANYFDRLLKLSTFEFAHRTGLSYTYTNQTGVLDMNQKVNYIKTFENYTLLSALRELLDGYNCALKLDFTRQTTGTGSSAITSLIQANLRIRPKSGRKGDHYNYDFTDSREIKTMDKNSFGTSVVSNAENVVSTNTKTFPSQGSVRLSADTYKTEFTDASLQHSCIRLPSKAYKVNKITMFDGLNITFGCVATGVDPISISPLQFGDATDSTNIINSVIQWLQSIIDAVDNSNLSSAPKLEMKNALYEYKQQWSNYGENQYNEALENACAVIYDGFNYDPVNDTFSSDNELVKTRDATLDEYYILLADKELRNNIKEPKQCLYWERGSNLIKGFEMWYLERYGMSEDIHITNHGSSLFFHNLFSKTVTASGGVSMTISIGSTGGTGTGGATYQSFNFQHTTYRVEYIPMSDIKIKYDNAGITKDSQYYNQNGKLTDGVALSKLLLGYSKEIESDTITRYKNVYKYSDCISVGELVLVNNKPMVCSNVSLTFHQSENDGYYIEGEYTLTGNVATKSLLTNPNTNIRDYGIPQSNNVNRKQIYRDFYELDYSFDTNSNPSDYYLPFEKIVNLTETYSTYNDHTVVMRLGYSSQLNGSSYWYYQLPTTVYQMKKQRYEVVDFLDNNIIGYGSQNVWSGFDLSRIITTHQTDNIHTPISYVDNIGEVKSFDLAFCSNDQIANIYDRYLRNAGETYDGSLYNYSVFIPQEIYDYTSSNFIILPALFFTDSLATIDNVNHTIITNANVLTPYLENYNDLSIIGLNISITTSSPNPFTPVSVVSTSLSRVNNNVILTINYDPSVTLTDFVAILQLVDNTRLCNDMKISVVDYNKDALEVPVFEYACQIDDSDNVIIGEDILDSKITDFAYIYPVKTPLKGVANVNNGDFFFNDTSALTIYDENWGSDISPRFPMKNNYFYNDMVAKFDYANKTINGVVVKTIQVRFYGNWTRNSNGNIVFQDQYSYNGLVSLATDRDFVIGRYSLNVFTYMTNVVAYRKIPHNLMMILGKLSSTNIKGQGTNDAYIELYINSYKE